MGWASLDVVRFNLHESQMRVEVRFNHLQSQMREARLKSAMIPVNNLEFS